MNALRRYALAMAAGSPPSPIALLWRSAGRRPRAASPAASASGDAVTLRIGTTSDADTINPFTMLETLSFEAVGAHLQPAVRPRRGRPAAPHARGGGAYARERRHLGRRQDRDGQAEARPQVVGRHAADGVGRRLDLQLLRGQRGRAAPTWRSARWASSTPWRWIRRRCASSARSPRRTSSTRTCPSSRSTSGSKVPPEKAGSSYRNKPPLVGSGPFLIQEWKPGSYLKLTRNPEYWGEQPARRRDRLRRLPERRDHGLRPADRRPRRGAGHPPGAVPGGQEPARHHRASTTTTATGTTSTSTATTARTRWATRCCSIPGSARRSTTPSTARSWRAWPSTASRPRARRIMPPDNWTDPDYHWQPPADQLYSFDLAKASQLLDEAGLRQGRPTACASTRASRSRCASGRSPTTSRSRRPAR